MTRELVISKRTDSVPTLQVRHSALTAPIKQSLGMILEGVVGGSGQDLCWVSRAVGLHRGRIEIKPAADKGTSCIIAVPFGVDDA